MTKQYNLGDIVKISDEGNFYIITDKIDYTQTDDTESYIDYEVVSILPIDDSGMSEILVISQEDSELIAEAGTKKHDLIMDYIKTERSRRKLDESPYYLEVSNPRKTNDKDEGNELAIYEKKQKNESKKFSMTEFGRMMKSDSGEKKIERLVSEMDKRLELLHNAIQDGRDSHAKSHTERLEEIRKELLELEYFQLEKRRRGVSIIIKD